MPLNGELQKRKEAQPKIETKKTAKTNYRVP